MMKKHNTSLLAFNTFNIDVKAMCLIEYDTVEELISIVGNELPKFNRFIHIGGGSNLLFMNDFDGLVVHSLMKGIAVIDEDCDSVWVEVQSGVVWDDFVEYCVANRWGGVENLSLIPGEVGASAVQNIGAYGVEVKDVITRVNALEIASLQPKEFSLDACEYGYRDSVFKSKLKGKYIITSVVFQLEKQPKFQLGYQHLEAEVLQNGEVTLANIRKTIIQIRESKLPDPKLLGNAGSFFMNPVVSKDLFLKIQSQYPTMPHYYVSGTEEKIPAGWLIEQCGWKGKQVGNVAAHDKQALVIVNKGGATGGEVVQLAASIQQSVLDIFGITLSAEVNYV